MNLQTPDENFVLRDIEFENKLKIGEQHLQFYTMADAENVPALCGSRINYDKYSTDKTKFSIGFASPIGNCFPATIFITSTFLLRMLRRPYKN